MRCMSDDVKLLLNQLSHGPYTYVVMHLLNKLLINCYRKIKLEVTLQVAMILVLSGIC